MGFEGFHLGNVIMIELLMGILLPSVKLKVAFDVAPTTVLERFTFTEAKLPADAVRYMLSVSMSIRTPAFVNVLT